MSKEQEPLVTDEDIRGFKGEPTIVKMLNVIAMSAQDVREVYESARSEDTDLIKDMLPYMQHKEECDVFDEDKATVDGEVGTGPWDTAFIPAPCSCGLSEVLQRINERSK